MDPTTSIVIAFTVLIVCLTAITITNTIYEKSKKRDRDGTP